VAKSSILADLHETLQAPMHEEIAVTIGPKLTERKDILVALKNVEEEIDKQFKTKFSLMRMGDKVGVPIPSIPTRMVSLDKLLIQCGGIPRGRIVEFFGPESGGKTTTALQIIAEEQKTGAFCAFVDAEHALDPNWCNTLGVNVEDLIIAQPDSGEQALETVIALVRSRAVSLIVVDSVSALTPQAELDGDMGDSHMGLQARMMSQACRKLRGICNQTGVTVIFINQIREKIGVMFGSPETTGGGRALKHYASVRIDIRKIGAIKEADEVIGNRVRFKIVKNKVGSPFREAEIDLLYGYGLNIYGDWLDVAADRGVIAKAGSWYSFGADRIGQGRISAYTFLKTNPDVFSKVQEALDKVL